MVAFSEVLSAIIRTDMRAHLISILLLFISLTVVGQKPLKKIIFFESGRFIISPQNKLRVDSLIDKIKNKDFEITLIGHADTVGSEKTNMRISKRRTLSVSNYFISKGIDKTKITNKYFGELNPLFSNATKNERRKNRCVEIVVQLPNEKEIPVATKQKEKIEPEKKKIENDTIIYGRKGTQIIVSAETFYPYKVKDIDFNLTEIYTMCDMLNNNTITRATNGDCLTSAGMLFVKPTVAGVEIQPNKGKFVTIKIPTKNGVPDKSMKLYGGVKGKDNQMVWKDIKSEISYEENGNQYYVFKMDTLVPCNLDKPIGVLCRKDGHKIKIPQFINVVICQTYPEETYLSIADKITERKFALDKVNDSKKPIITIVAYDEGGTAYVLKEPLSKFKYRRWKDMYVIKKNYFTKVFESDRPMKPNDYLCKYLENE